MAQKAIQSTHYAFKVEAAPSFMQLADGTFVRDGFTVNRRVDNMAVLGKVTDRYGIVQNDDLIDAAETAFAKAGLRDFKRNIVVTGEGERMYAVYNFKSHVKALEVGDEVGLRLIVQNSFDGSLRGSLLAAMERLLCANGLTGVDEEFGLTQKHGSKISVDFVGDALAKAMAAFDTSIATFNRMARVGITQAQGHAILANLAKAKTLSGKLHEGIETIWTAPTHAEDSARNLFNLYNAVTQYTTHEVAGERFELANRVAANVLKTLERASRDANRLAKLVAVAPASQN